MKTIVYLLVFGFTITSSSTLLLAQGTNLADETTFTKDFQGETITTQKKFTISAKYKSVNISIYATIENGSIELQIIKPDGSVYKKIEADKTSDVSSKQQFSLDSTSEGLTGDWLLKVNAKNAEGRYSVRIKQF